MPRPKLYKTIEEKADANRAKSKRHYNKKKTEIAEQRRAKYCQSQIDVTNQDTRHTKQNDEDIPVAEKDLQSCLWHAKRFQTRVSSIVGEVPKGFVGSICQEYLQSLDKTAIQSYAAKFEKFLKWVLECHDRVLQLVGTGRELDAVTQIANTVRELNRMVDELLVYAILGPEEFLAIYEANKFEFQE
ncbi:hypothetical protein CPB83DRAFT_898544 [Crepidotus variabilis]|uniref:Uncharacterized protein n=1 Tax=Crepidotus variabilis TaxID=179855 RepID=A0A9P6E6S2_9AGAR|nr:hypothetical protein CPB83DRAFT_898544 [Crepidotus variabilis]